MNGFRLLTSASEVVSEVGEAAKQSAGTHPAFYILVGLVIIGFAVMIVQNFIIKKEEYYK